MADFGLENLKELEDAAAKFGLAPDVEARFGRKALEAERSGLSYQRLAPNVRSTFGHRHAAQEETYVVVGGSGRAKVGDDIVGLRRWDALRVAPEAMRAFEAGPDGIEFIAFGAGDSGDSEMVEGWWSD